ncbi:hypothetical protein Scep_006032 [Stephania cephalantha]|uniref:RING-type E3 ubiquitin transferase n=1 Tax=Stephania cephalantha TaxID=152367 RepID=A0AAP0K8G2_9MAGN
MARRDCNHYLHVAIDPKTRLKQIQPQLCGYPGFDLTCDSLRQTVFHLPSGEDMFIRDINYPAQEIQVYDPSNCLPLRLLTLNLSGSPFQGRYYQNYTFLNCSSQLVRSRLFTPIPCMSSSTHSVIATASMTLSGLLSDYCELIKTVLVPVAAPVEAEKWFSSDLSGDLRLTWREPACGDCVSRGGNCWFKNNMSLDIACFNVPQRDLPRSRSLPTGLALGLGLPAFLITLGLVIFFCMKTVCCDRNGPNSVGPSQPSSVTAGSSIAPQPTTITGLDGPTIDSYPKVVLGESRRLPRPDDSTCSICLSEYRPNETLKLIPECKHCFHVECIDEWLRVNAACPVCRNSPSRMCPP